MIQGVLSILFVTLSIIVILAATLATWKAYKTGANASSEDPAVASRIFAPAGFIPHPAEKNLQKEWDALPAHKTPARTGH